MATLLVDGAPVEMPDGTWKLSVGDGAAGDGAIATSPSATLAWRELEKLPALTELSYRGHDDGLLRWLPRARGLRHLIWEAHRRDHLDLRRTRLEQLGVDAAPSLTLQVPRTLRELRLLVVTGRERMQVAAKDAGAELALTMLMAGRTAPRVVAGLDALPTLRIWFARSVRIAALGAYRHLTSLEIMGDPSCAIPDPHKLAKLPSLRELSLRSCYGLAVERFPTEDELPQLESLTIEGIGEDAARALRERVGRRVSLTIRGVKSSAWLRDQIENPFRDWLDDHGARVARVACAAWRDARRALAELGPDPGQRRRKAILRGFVETFNRLERERGLDTIMVEQIADAFFELGGTRAPAAWFDELREF